MQPEGEPAFEAKTDAWMVGTEGAHEGMVIPVLYDQSDHSKLVVDNSDAAWKPADTANTNARIAAHEAEMGMDPARTAAMLEMRRAAVADPAAFRKLMREQGPAAFGLPGAPLPEQAATPAAPLPQQAATPAAEDPLDRLTKLADLHDRGALTDAEFEAEKRKLLGELISDRGDRQLEHAVPVALPVLLARAGRVSDHAVVRERVDAAAEDPTDRRFQVAGIAGLTALEVHELGMDRRQHRGLPLAGVEPALLERDLVLVGSELCHGEQRTEIGERSDLDARDRPPAPRSRPPAD